MSWLTRTFTTDAGRKPFEEWIASLDPIARAEMLLLIDLLEEHGTALREPFAKHLEEGIWELRARGPDGIYRVLYFHWFGHTFGLLHGFAKKTQKTPRRTRDCKAASGHMAGSSRPAPLTEEDKNMAKDDWAEFREKLLDDPATRAAYEARRPAYEFAVQLAELRRQRGLSQAALAKRAGMTQSEVARIESAEASPTLDTMARLLAAAEADLDIKFRDAGGKVVRLPMVFKGAQLAPRSRRGLTTRAPKTASDSLHSAKA